MLEIGSFFVLPMLFRTFIVLRSTAEHNVAAAHHAGARYVEVFTVGTNIEPF